MSLTPATTLVGLTALRALDYEFYTEFQDQRHST